MKKSISILLTVCLLFTCFLLTASAAIPGDVDGDGAVSPADARFALRASVKLETPDAAEFAAADVDGDGVLTPSDARVILRISVRLDEIVDGKIVPYGSVKQSGTLRIGTVGLGSIFSPFFSESAYDQDVWAMTAVHLLDNDRLGAVVEKGVHTETIPYNGTDYTYPGLADLTVTANADGTVDYDFTLRDGVKFSDGTPLTVDDVIFSMYVLSDPTYDGSSTFFSLPIEGMAAYRAGMETLADLIYNAGRDNADFSRFTEAQQKDFWEKYDATLTALVQDIVGFCIDEGYAANAAEAAAVWGFEGVADEAEFAAMLSDVYGANAAAMVKTEAPSITIDDVFPNFVAYSGKGVYTGASADSITGIVRTGKNSLRVRMKNSLRVRMTELSAPAVYQLGVAVAPLHYYGDKALYDYDHNRFGFPKGDLSSVRAKNAHPLGAGPYVFEKYENGVVTYTANEHYYLGAPKTKNVQLFNNAAWKDFEDGKIDVISPIFSQDMAAHLCELNSNHELSGDKVTTCTIDNLGYGYLGISAKAVNVGGAPGSEASKNLRKAFATVLSVYRDATVEDYYGDAAVVINYPIPNTSWAAPQRNDEGYEVAFSRDVNGNAIYTDGMTQAEKEAAALAAALGYFRAAGYTVKDGKVTAAPAGAKMKYDLLIPGDGRGDHPAFLMANRACEALASVGVTLNVVDLADSSELWSGIAQDRVDMWCAAWGATPDPDMYQIYYSGTAGGKEPGGSNYMYDIADAQLDRLILDARGSVDQAYRKGVYKKCLDIIADWAVELPVYQRQGALVFSCERVDIDTVMPDITTYYGWLNGIRDVELR